MEMRRIRVTFFNRVLVVMEVRKVTETILKNIICWTSTNIASTESYRITCIPPAQLSPNFIRPLVSRLNDKRFLKKSIEAEIPMQRSNQARNFSGG